MNNGGRYPARPRVEFLSDGRIFRLIESFTYIDPEKKTWTAPKDAEADGASIPPLLWPIIGSPLTGKYRDASIIHDFYCSRRIEPWKAVHRVFFDAMLTSGVSKRLAKVMYAGVYFGGPRWTDMDVANNNLPEETDRPEIACAGDVHSFRTGEYDYKLTEEDISELTASFGNDDDQSIDIINAEIDERLLTRKPHWHYRTVSVPSRNRASAIDDIQYC